MTLEKRVCPYCKETRPCHWAWCRSPLNKPRQTLDDKNADLQPQDPPA